LNFKKLKKLKLVDFLLFGEALFYSAYCRFVIFFIPLKKFASKMGTYMNESPLESDDKYPEAFEIKKAIGRVHHRVPWRCMCYEQAFIGKLMLNRRKTPTTIYFGVCKDENLKIKAHAWLRCGDKIITGKKGMGKFKVVATFA